MKIYEIQERTPQLLASLLDIWEKSVRATHLFLSDAEIDQIKDYVPQALSGVEHLIAAETESEGIVAFMGTETGRLEMLFVLPEQRGGGIGRQLIQYGIQNYRIEEFSIYGALLIFSMYPLLPDQPPIEELQDFVTHMFMSPFERLGKVFNLNRRADIWLINQVFQKTGKRIESNI